MDRYTTKNNKFKEMTCPDNPKEKSRFCGCVREMMSKKGGNYSLETAKKICGKIKQLKESVSSKDLLVIYEFIPKIVEKEKDKDKAIDFLVNYYFEEIRKQK